MVRFSSYARCHPDCLRKLSLCIWTKGFGELVAEQDELLGPEAVPTTIGVARSFFQRLLKRKNKAIQETVNWGRSASFFQYPLVNACCGMDFPYGPHPRRDESRFGLALQRFSPRQADLLMVVGTITHKQAPILRAVYEQIPEPKWVIGFGVCASSGGFYQNYATVQGIDSIIPVDIYVPGCPPDPEAVLNALEMLQNKIRGKPKSLLSVIQANGEV